MTILVSWLWQGLLVAGAAVIIARACRRLSAAARYGIWWIALLIIAVLPIVPAALASLLSWLAPVSQTVPAAVIHAGTNANQATRSLALPLPPFWVLSALVAGWMALVLIRLAQIGRGLAAMRQLKHESQPFDPARERALAMWPAARAAGRRCDLRISDRVAGACVAGLGRPAILLPPALLDALPNEELDQIILHERAHVARYDDWSRLAQCLLAAVLGVHPAVWLINRRIDLERESACDDEVVLHTRAARAYAECLAHVAALRLAGSPREPIVVAAAARPSRLLRARVIRLIDREAPSTARLGWTSATLGLAALGTIMLAVGLVPPPITFLPRATAILGALPAVSLHWHAALPSARASEAFSTIAVDDAQPSSLYARERARPPSVHQASDDVAAVQRPARSETRPQEAAPPLASRAILLQSAAAPLAARPIEVPQPSRSPSEPYGSTFVAFGNHAAHAGVALGSHLQEMGGNLGGWFARVARGVSTP